MNNKIKELRDKLDSVDDKIAELIKERILIALEILEIKKGSSLKIEDSLRENSIIERMCRNNPQIESLISDIYRRIFHWVKNR